jgi:hypothetical protein
MVVNLPLGPWRGFWTYFTEHKHHPMQFNVLTVSGRFEADGTDEVGRFALSGELLPPSNQAIWTKSYENQHQIEYRAHNVGDTAGFVGRWFSDKQCGGTFALWAGDRAQPPVEILKAIPRDKLHFKCICGRSLEIRAEQIGTEIECPWCAQLVIAPDESGQVAVSSPVSVRNEEAELYFCANCASPGWETMCSVCQIPVVSRDAYTLSPGSCEQKVISPHAADWILRKFAWLLQRCGPQDLRSRALILPTSEWFPGKWEPTRAGVQNLLLRLQGFAGLGGIPVRIALNPEATKGPSSIGLGLQKTSGAAGCFIAPVRKEDAFWIEIGEGLLEDRVALIATLGHELGHLFVYERLNLRDRLPLDHEFLTDLVTIALGFGSFTCEASFQFRTWAAGNVAGWSTSSLGYLKQADLAFALALWGAVLEKDLAPVIPHLGINTKSYFRQSCRFFENTPDLIGRLRKLVNQ